MLRILTSGRARFGWSAAAAGLQADARGDRAAAGAVVERRGPEHGLHAALAIVEIGLQQSGRFPRVHGGIVEIELGHCAAA
jgi:hypothetical protein